MAIGRRRAFSVAGWLCAAGFFLAAWTCSTMAQTYTTSGTGFIVGATGYILTNYHVVEGATGPITVTVSGGKKYVAELVEYSATFEEGGNDIALLKIAAVNLPTLPLADSDGVQLFDQVVVIGYPLSFQLGVSVNVTGGNITSFRDLEDGPEVFQIDAVVNHGNSGGPVLDEFGRVIGIVTSKLEGADVEGVSFVVPVNHATALVSKHIPGGSAAPPGLALTSRQIVSQATPAIVYIEWSDVYLSEGRYEEDFSKSRDWYAEYWNERGYIEISQDEERSVRQAESPCEAGGPFFEIDILFTECTNDNCGAGLAFYAPGEEEWSFLLLISPDGWYAFYKVSPTRSTWVTVDPWTQSSRLRTGLNVVNHVKIEAAERIALLYFNGEKAGSLNAVLPLGGSVALCVVSFEGRMSARFDNLMIYGPERVESGGDMIP